jgi:hypothetical protein
LVPFLLGMAGVLLLIPGASFVPSMFFGLKPGDDVVALTPLFRIRLDQLGMEPVVTKLVIPDTPQWKRIRRIWGEPSYNISAVSSERRFTYCLPHLGLNVKVSGRSSAIPFKGSGPPYGYSTDCDRSSLAFRAVSGSELTVTISKFGDPQIHCGELLVVSDWFNTKDKLVGVSLDEELRPIVMASACLGSMLIVGAAVLLLRHRHLRQFQ